MIMKNLADIEKSRKEYLALPNIKWRKDYFDENTGGFVATQSTFFFERRHNKTAY